MVPMSLLVIVALLLILVMKVTPGKRKNKSYIKLVQWASAIYAAVLILAVPVVFMLPEDTGFSADMDRTQPEIPVLREMARSGDMERAAVYQDETWDMAVESQEIVLNLADGDNARIDLPIFVEKVKDQEQTIEAMFYRTPLIVEGSDMSDQLNSIRLSTSSDRINIVPPAPARIELSMFKQEFPITQFTGERMMNENVYNRNQQLLYFRIPEDVQLQYEDNIELVYVESDNS